VSLLKPCLGFASLAMRLFLFKKKMKNNRLAIEALREELESIKANSKIKKPGKSKTTKIVECKARQN
jgi:predicted RNase H-like nuclease (RuvC/YqgF family)